MKRTIYESFVRYHLTYYLSTWGAKKTAEKTVLAKQVKKVWRKIGNRLQHTYERLAEHKILKIQDELKLAEIKTIWRWEKLPLGLTNIIEEQNDRVLRGRNFTRAANWKHDNSMYIL